MTGERAESFRGDGCPFPRIRRKMRNVLADARRQRGLVHGFLLHEQLEHPEPPPADGDRLHAGIGAALVQHGPHGDGAEQRPPRDVLGQFLDLHAGLDVAHIRLAEHQPVKGDGARGAEGDFLLLGHRDISATGQPGASLPASKPVTENPAHLLL